MHKLKFYSYFICCLSIKTAFADTTPVRFEIGDIAPRQTIKINMNIPKWPGYHDIKCDIIDPSSTAVIQISSEDSTSERIQINQTKYYDFPVQISLKEKQNKLILYKTYNQDDETTNSITFKNLDDDITISVKNCEISPNAILSKDLVYFPRSISCSEGTCKMQGGSQNVWNEFTAPDGKYTIYIVYYTNKIAEGYYSNSNYIKTLTPKYNIEPFRAIYTTWVGEEVNGVNCPNNDVLKCPLKNVKNKS